MDQLTLPGFELLGKIGQGGMATVWKARQLSLDRLVAVKVLSPRLASDPADVERFHAECRSAAMLKHPGIVQVYDATVHNGLYCLIMEYVAGESIGNRIRRKKRLTEDEVLFVLEHVSQALGYAWKTAGLIHCDIKPDNILIDSDGSVKVTDLGLAMTIGAMTSLAQAEEVMGTPHYMSPEQILGEPKLDCRTDIYSMGATLYQMLTGRMLFEGAADDAVLDMQVKDYAPDVMDQVPALSSRIAWLAEKMLARNREHRHADWSAVTADVERLMRRQFPAPPLPAAGASVMKRSARRQKAQNAPAAATRTAIPDSQPRSPVPEAILRAVLLIAVLVALAGSAFFILSRIRPPNAPAPPPALSPAPAPAPPVPPVPADPAKRAQDMFDFAESWWKANPERYQEAIDQFDRVMRDTQGTKYSLMALDAIRSIKQAQESAMRDVMAELKAGTDPLAEKKQFAEAARIYDSYSGRLASETKRDRQVAAQQLRQQGENAAAVQEAAAQEIQKAYENVLDDAASCAVQGRLTNAIEQLAAAEGRSALASRKNDLAAVAALFRKAAATDRKILDSFAAQKDQEVTVHLLTGPKTLVISSAAGGWIHGDQKVTLGEGVAAATVKIKFSLEELAPRERVARLGPDTDPDVALFKGSKAAQARSFAEARTLFSTVPGDFGSRLLSALARREAELQLVPQPDTAAAPTPPDTAAPVPAPAPPAGDSLTPEAFCAQLSAANSGLAAWDITCETDANGRIIRVSCPSRFLQNLEPFRKIAGSLVDLDIPQNQSPNLAPLAALPALRRLNLADSPMSDLNPIKDLRLEAVCLNNTRIKDLSPLRNMPIRDLEIANTRVFAFDAIRLMSLNRLNIANTQFGDLSFIREMPLRELNLSGTKVFDFTSLRRFQLVSFLAENTGFKDLTVLGDMPLADLNIANTKVTDLNPLRRLPLRGLNLAGVSIRDLSSLKDMKLTGLRIDNCKIKDLTPLAAMPLQNFYCNGTLVEDLTPLRGMPLIVFEAANTMLSDLGPLEGMPLQRVVISYTRVSDLAPLAQCPLRELRCEGTRPENLFVLRATPLEILYIDMRQDQMPMGLRRIFPNLKNFNGNMGLPRNPP